MNWERVIATLRERANAYRTEYSSFNSARLFVIEAIAAALEEGLAHERGD